MFSVVPYNALLGTGNDSAARDRLLEEKLGVSPAYLNGNIELDRRGILAAAKLLYEGGLAQEMPKHRALAQITGANIAALLCQWEDSYREVLQVGLKIAELFTSHNVGNSINEVRRIVFEQHHRRPLSLNLENAVDRWGIEYTDLDLKRGVKFPLLIGPREIFLFGVYFAQGSFDYSKNRFEGCCNETNIEFVNNNVRSLIYDIFNIDARVDMINHKTIGDKSGQKRHPVQTLRVDSKAHYSFLQKHFLFYRLEDGTRNYQIPGMLNRIEDISAEDVMKYFFMGIIAGKGIVERTNGPESLSLYVPNKKGNFLPVVMQIAKQAGYDGLTASSTRGFIRLHFDATTVDAMQRSPVDPLYEHQQGLFVNPSHLSKLA